MRARAAASLGLSAALAGGAVSSEIGHWDRHARAEPPPRHDRSARPALAPPFPGPARITRARAYADRRQGTVALAVVDTSGRIAGWQRRRSFRSASVVKAMIMVAYLEGVAGRGGRLSDRTRARLDAMIRRSDNSAATEMIHQVGEDALRHVARRTPMRDFTPLLVPWGLTRMNAEDQARFFARIDDLTPGRYRAYARQLLTGIAPEQRWGIPAAAPAGATILFKGGWMATADGRWTVHQAGKLETREGELAVTIFSEGNPSEAYGRETVRGVAQRLLEPRATREG